uniref:Predicted protein n=1 Tax=Hordeum vulgare subsp. vulgare TaxID=112509 RepID=F2CR02_HORVV|nr:predicted protein [Hordeum vulgare subsp. vulgare]
MESHRRSRSTNRFQHQPLETLLYSIDHHGLVLQNYVFAWIFVSRKCALANSIPGASKHKGHLMGI